MRTPRLRAAVVVSVDPAAKCGCGLHGYSQWFSVLSQVHGSTEQEIREMHDEQANPQNAVVRLHARVCVCVRRSACQL